MLANIVALKNIVVSGSHGKTTTTSLVANILLKRIRPNCNKWWSYKFIKK